MARVHLSLMILTILVLNAACADASESSESAPTVYYSKEYDHEYNLDSISSVADAIITGKRVGDAEVRRLEERDGVEYSVSTFVVERVLRGGFEAGNTIELWQLGTDASNLASTLVDERAEFLLFLASYQPPQLTTDDDRFIPVGSDQGVYRDQGNETFKLVGSGRPLANPGVLRVSKDGGVSLVSQWTDADELRTSCVQLQGQLLKTPAPNAGAIVDSIEALPTQGLDSRLQELFATGVSLLRQSAERFATGAIDSFSTSEFSKTASWVCGFEIPIQTLAR